MNLFEETTYETNAFMIKLYKKTLSGIIRYSTKKSRCIAFVHSDLGYFEWEPGDGHGHMSIFTLLLLLSNLQKLVFPLFITTNSCSTAGVKYLTVHSNVSSPLPLVDCKGVKYGQELVPVEE